MIILSIFVRWNLGPEKFLWKTFVNYPFFFSREKAVDAISPWLLMDATLIDQ